MSWPKIITILVVGGIVSRGPLLVESLPGFFGHPGTIVSAVRYTDEASAVSSIYRASLRSPFEDAQPGFGPCFTFQAGLEVGGKDVDLAHICVRLNEALGAEMVFFVRNSQGEYKEVAILDAEE